MHAMHAMHAWLAAKRTPSIKPMMSSASATRRWIEKASANASASACCATGQCNNLRAAHRHLDSTWHNHNRQNQKKKTSNQDCLPRTLDRLSSGKPHSWSFNHFKSKRDNKSIQEHWVINSDLDLGCHDSTQRQETTIRSSGRNGGSLQDYQCATNTLPTSTSSHRAGRRLQKLTLCIHVLIDRRVHRPPKVPVVYLLTLGAIWQSDAKKLWCKVFLPRTLTLDINQKNTDSQSHRKNISGKLLNRREPLECAPSIRSILPGSLIELGK